MNVHNFTPAPFQGGPKGRLEGCGRNFKVAPVASIAALGQERIYVAFCGQTWILDAGEDRR